MRVLDNNRGETLIEVLASILIATLSVALLFGCVMASSSMDQKTQNVDYAHYDALAAAETRTGTATTGKNVSIKNTDESIIGGSATIPIEIYGGEDIYSYKREVISP